MLFAGGDVELPWFSVRRPERDVEVDRLLVLDDRLEKGVIGVGGVSRADRLPGIERHDIRDGDAVDADDLVAGLDAGGFGRVADGEADGGEVVPREREPGAAADHQLAVLAGSGEAIIDA